MSFEWGASEQGTRAQRIHSLIAILITMIGACLLRLAYLQLIRGRAMEEASESNRTQLVVERAPRGRIIDRNGMVLADDRPVFVALFTPMGLSAGDIQAVLDRLSPVIAISRAELEHRLQLAIRSKSMLRISDRLTREQAFRILQDRTHLPGVSLSVEQQRFYPGGMLASHVLGYVGQIADEELETMSDEGYHSGDWIGKSGLERLYDSMLHGQDGGYLIEVDARGRQVRVIRHVPPQAGKDLILTLDGQLEELAERRLRESGEPGAAVVLDPKTGGVLALASSPGFDPNLFLPLGNSEERNRLLRDPRLPLYNRSIQALYAPGSTFKIITSLAGLQEKRIDPQDTVDCKGSYILGKERRVFHCWKPKGHGTVNFRRALAESCDVYFYVEGLKIGAELIEKYAKQFGFGQRTGIDLPSEKRGLLPYAWKESIGQHWSSGDTLNYAIGQGALQVTPLQMANMLVGVANRGIFWQPYLVSEARGLSHDVQRFGVPRVTSNVTLSDFTWEELSSGLTEVVRNGTGVAAQLPGIDVAGKSGTAQTPHGREHGWFVAYAPVADPQAACVVIIEHGGHGGSVAAPIVHDLLAMSLGKGEVTGSGPARIQSD
jgi:penicillin-binding protein 2